MSKRRQIHWSFSWTKLGPTGISSKELTSPLYKIKHDNTPGSPIMKPITSLKSLVPEITSKGQKTVRKIISLPSKKLGFYDLFPS